MVIGLTIATVIGLLVGLGVINIYDLPRIIENFWTGSKTSGAPL